MATAAAISRLQTDSNITHNPPQGLQIAGRKNAMGWWTIDPSCFRALRDVQEDTHTITTRRENHSSPSWARPSSTESLCSFLFRFDGLWKKAKNFRSMLVNILFHKLPVLINFLLLFFIHRGPNKESQKPFNSKTGAQSYEIYIPMYSNAVPENSRPRIERAQNAAANYKPLASQNVKRFKIITVAVWALLVQ